MTALMTIMMFVLPMMMVIMITSAIDPLDVI